MIFIKFNFADETSGIFNLDYIIEIKEISQIKILVRPAGAEEFEFMINMDEFVSKVYSDENEKEYALVEIEELGIETGENLGD